MHGEAARLTAVDVNGLTGDEARFRRCEEVYDACDLFGLTDEGNLIGTQSVQSVGRIPMPVKVLDKMSEFERRGGPSRRSLRSLDLSSRHAPHLLRMTR